MYEFLMNAPHILIGGTTGSGKSVLLNGIILELMRTYEESEARLYLIDPKSVELYPYTKTGFCERYVEDSEEVPSLLNEVIEEMESRRKEMRERGLKNYDGERVYLIIDELADLMISPEKNAIRVGLQKILQKGRACGIHVIAATQAPNREVIPASIVLNFTDRIALRCLSAIESRQLINVGGAESLPRYGKGLYYSPEGIKVIDIPMVEDEEIAKTITAREVKVIEPVPLPSAPNEDTKNLFALFAVAAVFIVMVLI